MNHDFIDKLCLNSDLRLTDLRKDVFNILFSKKKPMGAYEILEKLKKKRPKAEPPTVYRVLDYLVENKLIHRIESQNTFVCCSQLETHHAQHQSILLSCKVCHGSFEYNDANVFRSITQFSARHDLQIDDALIEIKGTCKTCLKAK